MSVWPHLIPLRILPPALDFKTDLFVVWVREHNSVLANRVFAGCPAVRVLGVHVDCAASRTVRELGRGGGALAELYSISSLFLF